VSSFHSHRNILGIDSNMGVDTMLLETGKGFGSGALYPIRLTLSRKYPIPNDETEQDRLVAELISRFRWCC